MQRVKAQQIAHEAVEKRDGRIGQYEQEYTNVIDQIRKQLDKNPEITYISRSEISNQVATWLTEDDFIIKATPFGILITWPDVPSNKSPGWREGAKTMWDQKAEELQKRYKAIKEVQAAEAAQKAVYVCEECEMRPATCTYGKLKTCDECNKRLNDEFDEEYR